MLTLCRGGGDQEIFARQWFGSMPRLVEKEAEAGILGATLSVGLLGYHAIPPDAGIRRSDNRNCDVSTILMPWTSTRCGRIPSVSRNERRRVSESATSNKVIPPMHKKSGDNALYKAPQTPQRSSNARVTDETPPTRRSRNPFGSCGGGGGGGRERGPAEEPFDRDDAPGNLSMLLHLTISVS
jgi:hypothetical protein